MFNKFLITVCLVVAVSLISGSTQYPSRTNVTYIGNNLYIGQRQRGDWLMAQYPVYKGALRNKVVTETLKINAGYNITFVSSMDQALNKTWGASVRLVNGGPGSKNATLLFVSKVGQPINHRVNAFGGR